MAGYDREEFSRHTNDQLLDYIEQQVEQLNRFETRFRDVVRAYRGALKEKEALERTLQALSLQQEGNEESGRDLVDIDKPQNEEESDGQDSARTMEGESTSETEEIQQASPCPPKPPTNQLKQQITTLTAAMATLMEEKSKMETNFQKDKKAVMSQQDLFAKQLQGEQESAKKEMVQYQALLLEVQDNLRKEKVSRSEEQSTHADMLRELQQLIASERNGKEAILLQMQEGEMEIERLQKQISEDRTREYEENLKIMSVELEQVRSRLMAAEKQSHQPPPLLLQLQEDMARMKEDHSKAIDSEQERANEAETRSHSQAEREELRVASLELKLTELSKTVGNYDQQREADQLAIQKLKERISQLDSENTVLTKVHLERQDTSNNEASSQVGILQEKLSRLKALLMQATLKISEKTTLPTNVEELTVSDYNEMLSLEPSRMEYEQELYQVKEEFEKYKLRAQSVLKSRGSKMESEVTNEELKKLAKQNRSLQEQLLAAQGSLEEQEERQLLRNRKLREEMRELLDKHKQQMVAMETMHKQRLHELSSQMHSTRERSLKLIADKDMEIERLKLALLLDAPPSSSLPATPTLTQQHKNYHRHLSTGSTGSQSNSEQVVVVSSLPSNLTGESSLGAYVELSGEPNNDASAAAAGLHLSLKSSSSEPGSTQTAVQELLDQPSPLTVRLGGVTVGGASEVRLLHHAQEKQRRKEESILARRKMFELEDTIRELQEREEKRVEQTGFLKEEIRKLQRDRSRETENMEYLKNIIIHFMSADSAGRHQMINPIAAVLHFSKDEVVQIRKSIAARRWISTPTKK